MSKSKELMKKLFLVMVMLCMFATTITISTGKTIFAEESEETEEDPQPDIGDPIEADPAEDIYESITGMADTPPSDWYQEKDPYGYGLNNMFFLNAQQELLVYQYNGHSNKTIESYDTLKAKNEGDPLDGVKPRSYNIPKDYTLSHARTIAFDPTGSGRKDHIAVIGIYAKNYRDDDNPGHFYAYVMDKDDHLSNIIDLGEAKWITDQHATGQNANNDYMWDFNSANFMDITAGDFDGDGKDSLVVWACGSSPVLKQVNVTSQNGSIALNVLDANGYASVPNEDSWNKYENPSSGSLRYTEDANGLTHYLYYDKPKDQVVENRLSVVIRSGDFNGDGIDDLAVLSYLGRVTLGEQELRWGPYYVPMLSYSYGSKGDTRSITAGHNSEKNIAVQIETSDDDGQFQIAPMACGMAVGDIDGDHRDEAVIAGIYHEVGGSMWTEVVSGKWGRKKTSDSYRTVDKYRTVVAIYRGGSCLMFEKGLTTNAWTAGDGSASAGYYTGRGNETSADQSYQQMAVETVAINGKGSQEYIFLSGDLYTYDGGKLTCRYQPEYFQHVNGGTDNWTNEETYMRSMAVGNFDGNEEGREQIAFVTGAAIKSGKPYEVQYSMGMIGGVYEDNEGNPQPQAVSFYCTDRKTVLENVGHYYPGSANNDCSYMDCLNFDLCAWDNDSDGLHVKYVGKEYTYTDPAVMAILQAPPYFEEVKGAMTDMSTSYSITTTYEYETSQGNSTSFGAGADFEVEAEVVKFNVSAGYATDWSESFSNSWTDSETYTLNAIGEDQVLLYRTPVTIYKYQVETKSGWSDKNIIELSFPGKSTIAPMSVRDYNVFAAYYNEKAKELAQEINADSEEILIPDDKIPQLNLIEDEYLGNEGNPYAYMNTSSPLNDVTVLQKTPLPSGVGSSSMEYEWSREHATGYEESESHGFSFEFQLMFQFKIGHSGAALGGHVSLDYMRDFSTSRTEAKGIGASCAIGNLDPEALEEMGMSATAGRQYGFNSQLVTWDSDIVLVDSVFETSMESEFDGEFDDDENKRREMKYVPIFGYMLSGIKSATPPVTDLDCEFELDENEEMNILLTWSDPSTEYKRVGAYVIYQVQKDGSYKEIATVPADTTEYMFDDIDGRNEYIFVVRTKSGIHELYESVDSNKAYIYVEANALYSIELTSSDEDSDTYTITHTDGTKSYIVVKHGVSIIDIKKTGENGKYDTYTIYFSDGSTATYVVKNGEDGREIELRTYQPEGSDKQIIQWRYIGDEKWNDLVEVSNVAAIAGRKIELRINYVTDEATGETKGFIQWRYEGDGDDGWNNLIDIDELKGDKGDKGDQGEAGREVELQVFYYTDEETGEEKGIIQWRYVGDGDDEWRDLIASSDSALIQGEPGREVELKVVYYTDEETGEEKRAIQWRYVGDSDDSWTKLIDLSELKGDAGEDGKQIQLRYDDQVNAILWRYEGEDWQELVLLNEGALKGDKGDDGREILLNVDEDLGYIQWKYEGEDEWTNLIAIDKLKAAPAREIELQYDAKKRAVMWRYVGDDEWSDLFMIPTPSDGRNGHDGRGIVSVDRTARNGIIDTYTITYSDGTTSTFTVTNGTSSEHSYSTYTTYSTEHKSSSDQSSNSNTPSNNTTDPNQSNITYDNVGISNIKVDSNGDLIITLTDGSSVVVGNKEESKTDNQSMSDSGLLRTYYFNMPMSEFKSVNVDGKQIESDQYTVTSLGDGILVTIREEALGKSAKRMDVLGRSNVISSSLVNPSQSGFNSWTTILFGGWNTLLTIGLGILTSQFLKLKRSIR